MYWLVFAFWGAIVICLIGGYFEVRMIRQQLADEQRPYDYERDGL